MSKVVAFVYLTLDGACRRPDGRTRTAEAASSTVAGRTLHGSGPGQDGRRGHGQDPGPGFRAADLRGLLLVLAQLGPGTVSGALRSGRRAAAQALGRSDA
jgi:hypothetical protein